MRKTRTLRAWQRLISARSRRPQSKPISNGSSEPAVLAADRRPAAHPELERMRECRARKSPADRRVAHPDNHILADAGRARLPGVADHRVVQRLSIPSGKLLRMQEQARFSGDHNKMCI